MSNRGVIRLVSPDYQNDIAVLEQRLDELQASEKLQHALFNIASLTQTELPLEQFYKEVHDIVNQIIDAKNLFIALLNDDEVSMKIVYFVDEQDTGDKDITGKDLPIGEGLTSYIINTRAPQLLTPSIIETLIAQKKVKEVLGSKDFSSWMGAPMISGQYFHGVVVVQSYQQGFSYCDKDLKTLDFVANQIASAIECNVNTAQRREAQRRLAEQHRVLEQQNMTLNQTIAHLEKTQEELVQREKMAALGGLVAGIAHEINTPLGICVTGVSHLLEEFRFTQQAYKKGTLTEDDLEEFFVELEQGLKIIASNTERGAALVRSFKQVAVDQSSGETREINVAQYLDEIILSLKPKLKRVSHKILVDCPADIVLPLNAGALSQIMSNLIINSLIHGFDGIEQGRIQIKIQRKTETLNIHYADDGNGMDQQTLDELFEPFFTTKRGEGGSGLGTHLIFNLVQSMNGKIKVKSELNKGVAFLIVIPISH